MLIRIGTRGSRLAMTQAKQVARLLSSKTKRVRTRILIIKTTGDEFQSVELFKKTNIGVFTRAIEEALLNNKIDLAVHSLKDLPTDLPRGLILAAVPKREDPRDCIISKHRYTIQSLPKGASVATGSPRRKRQLLKARPDLRLVDIRGNLDTRVGRVLKENKYDAVILAYAGLKRLRRFLKFAVVIPVEKVLPAVGQAALGIQIRERDKELLKVVRGINHAPSELEVKAERSFLRTLGGGCRVPVGVSVSRTKGRLTMRATIFSTRTDRDLSGKISSQLSLAEETGTKLAKKLLKRGASKFLKEARHDSLNA